MALNVDDVFMGLRPRTAVGRCDRNGRLVRIQIQLRQGDQGVRSTYEGDAMGQWEICPGLGASRAPASKPSADRGSAHETSGCMCTETSFPCARQRFGCVHASNSLFHTALSLRIDAFDSGAPSPSRPRSASSKSPSASPCSYSSGSSAPTSFVLRANSGSTRLSNRSSRPRTLGRLTVIVPELIDSRRGLPCPLR